MYDGATKAASPVRAWLTYQALIVVLAVMTFAVTQQSTDPATLRAAASTSAQADAEVIRQLGSATSAWIGHYWSAASNIATGTRDAFMAP